MKNLYSSLLAVVVGIFTCGIGFAQIETPGTPLTIQQNLHTHNIPEVATPALDMAQINAEDNVQDKQGNWPRIAISQDVNYNLQNAGSWQSLPNGDKLWRLKITAPNAKAIVLAYEDFFLPNGAELYVFNEDKTEKIGAFTADNNKPTGLFSTRLVKGETVIVEYYEPSNVSGQGHFTISEVGHAYRLVSPEAADAFERNFGSSDPCQVNVNCSPEGDNWQDEKKGVGRILLKDGPNWGWCTGSLVNNTAQDCHPYFLTAYHCGQTSSSADKAQWIFYLNYEATGCADPGSDPVGSANSTTGCTLVAHSNDGGGSTGSDFQLVELNGGSPLPGTWDVYYNGWNATNTASTSGVGIHHPAGDIKKISTYSSSLTSSTWGGTPGTHWTVQWVSTSNGHGVTEGGSSGSPIFDQNKRIIGTLTGGSSYCSTPNNPDRYGKMWYHWDQNASPTGGDLKDFLDPGNTGTLLLDGTYAPCSPTAPNCAASASTTTVTAGGTVDFFDNSTGVPTSWSWDFGGGGTPNSSTDQNPTGIQFNTPGTYTVTLTATNAQGSCNTTLVITVVASTGCDTLNFPPPGTLNVYVPDVANPLDSGFIAGWNAYEDLAKAQRFDTYAPYTHVNGGLFYIFAAYDQGNASTARFTIWEENAGEPGAELATVDIPLANLDAAVPAGGGLVEILFPQPVNVSGNPFYFGVQMINFDQGDSLAIVSNSIGDPTTSGQSWELWSDGTTWIDMMTGWGGSFDIDLFISPYMTDVPVTAVPSASGTTACENGSITFDASGSSNATSFDWTFVGGTPNTSTNTSETVTYGAAGTYTAYLQAYGACNGYSLDSIPNITINASPVAAAVATDENCGAGDGSIDVTATGGDGGPYTYSIDGGSSFQPGNSFAGLTAGNYSVVVEDGNGCQGVTSITVGNTNSGPGINTSSTDEDCAAGNGTIDITITTGTTTPYQYSIDNGSNFQGTGSFTGLSSGTYIVVVEDGNGCQTTTTVNVGNNASTVSLAGTATNEDCSGANGTITLTATGGDGNYQYSIDNGSTFQAGNTFTGLTAGIYDCVVEDGNGCQGFTTITVGTNASSVTLTESHTDENCGNADGTIDITAAGGDGNYQYSIDNGTNFQPGNSFNGLTAGTYDIVVEDGNGCQATASVTLSNIGGPTISNITTTDVLCNGDADGEIVINATGGGTITYSIDNGTNFQPSNTFTNLGPGTYDIVVDNGACQSTSTATIGEPPLLSETTTVTDAGCSGTGSLDIAAAGGVSPYQYSTDGGTTFGTNSNITGLAPGNYDVVVMDANGCMTAVNTVTIGSLPSITLNNTVTDETCTQANGSIDITATGGDGGPYQFSIDGGTTLQGSNSFIGLSAGTYNVYVEDGSGCTATATVIISDNGAVNGTVSANQDICSGGTTTITASGGTSYSWDDGVNNVGTGTTIAVSPTTTTTYNVLIDNGTCTETLSTTVTVVATPVTTVSSASDTICAGEDVVLTAAGGSSYFWGHTTSTNATVTVNPTSTTTYSVVAQNGACSGNTAQVAVVTTTPAVASANANPTTAPTGTTINFDNSGSVGTSFDWDFDDGNNGTGASTTHSYGTTGTYNVILTATLGNCTDTDTVTVTITSGNDLAENSLNQFINVYPNPTNGEVNIGLDLDKQSDVRIEVFNTVGKLIDSDNLPAVTNYTHQLNILDQANGFYFVKIFVGDEYITKRVVLQK